MPYKSRDERSVSPSLPALCAAWLRNTSWAIDFNCKIDPW